ncbi:hypothetical protein GTW43_12625 [Streptomyces sp. SID5785]|uniref:hypothetical protein n=1 Tax=Streptomyces sp. SID5785 TaxID=2690309 RepID=UPI0013615D4D|nr:hypothetical protein [Streptomyces sp. SID5785]MZD05924.1 hypothetical protein [Streptomyces sp. SID5785]
MRRTASWPAAALAAAAFALATPVCAHAWADGDDTPWGTDSSVGESVDPADPADPAEPVEPVDPADPAEPADPVGPGDGDGAGLPEDSGEAPSTRGNASAPGALELSPATVRPGGTVTANTSSCGKDQRATGDANNVGAGDFPLQSTTQGGDLVGQFRVPSGARAGTFPISVTCESGTVVRQTLTVSAGGGGGDDGGGRTEMHGVHAGDGGSWGQLSPVQLGLGGALIAGALGAAGYYTWRRAADR